MINQKILDNAAKFDQALTVYENSTSEVSRSMLAAAIEAEFGVNPSTMKAPTPHQNSLFGLPQPTTAPSAKTTTIVSTPQVTTATNSDALNTVVEPMELTPIVNAENRYRSRPIRNVRSCSLGNHTFASDAERTAYIHAVHAPIVNNKTPYAYTPNGDYKALMRLFANQKKKIKWYDTEKKWPVNSRTKRNMGTDYFIIFDDASATRTLTPELGIVDPWDLPSDYVNLFEYAVTLVPQMNPNVENLGKTKLKEIYLRPFFDAGILIASSSAYTNWGFTEMGRKLAYKVRPEKVSGTTRKGKSRMTAPDNEPCIHIDLFNAILKSAGAPIPKGKLSTPVNYSSVGAPILPII